MSIVDPAQATAAYLAQLAPAAQARAAAHTSGSNWIELWSWIVVLASAWLILRSGILAALRERVERTRPRPNFAAFVCGASFFLLAWLTKLPWKIYTDWARERSYGLLDQTFGAWLAQSAIQGIFNAVFGGLLIVCLYALIRRAGKRWWVFAAGLGGTVVFLMLVVQPFVLGPMLYSYKPAPTGPVREAVASLARQADIPADRIVIYDGSKQSNAFTANVDGVRPFARIALSDTMFKQGADRAEVRAVVGHELGHYRHLDQIQLSLMLTVLFLLSLWVVDRAFPTVAERLSSARVRDLANPATLPIFVALLTTCLVVATPIINTDQRHIEMTADRFGLDLAREPDGAARALLATADYRASSPSPIEEALFYNHPSIARRIRIAMEWKANREKTDRAPL
jgi:STE24 endopeptidase